MSASVSPSIGLTTLTCQPRPSITSSSSMRLPPLSDLFRGSWQSDLNRSHGHLDSPPANNQKSIEGFIDLTADSQQDSKTSARIHRFSTTTTRPTRPFNSISREPDYFESLDSIGDFFDMPPRRRRESTAGRERPSKKSKPCTNAYEGLSTSTSNLLSRPVPPVYKIESSPIGEVLRAEIPESSFNPRKRKNAPEFDSKTEDEDLATAESKDEQDKQLAETIKAQAMASQGPTKFNQLTCIICMDRMENMTATHCGHVFCHTCIQEALIAGENALNGPKAPKCPMCRTKVNRKPKSRSAAPEMIPLCLKLKKRDKGKQKESL